jgi:putative chitinase
MTPETLQAATGCTPMHASMWADPLTAAMDEFGIDTPARQAAFLAQVAHETGRFRWTREIWGPTLAQQRYEMPHPKAIELGNTQPGDGRRFCGRGLIQITGRANYMKVAAKLGIDCVNRPELLEEPEDAARSAGDFWQYHGLNELADDGHFEAITRRINGGLTGYTERCVLYDQAKRVLGA